MVAGRTTEPRTATIGTTNASAAVTGAAGTFLPGDGGRRISGTGIPAGATLLSVTSDTAATLSANATATGSPTATIGIAGESVGPGGYGFVGWSPESDSESKSYSLAAVNAGTPVPPSRLTNAITPVTQRSRG